MAARAWPCPRPAPPPQVDGSSSWDCSGALSREPQAAAGTRWPGRPVAASSALRTPRPAPQRSRSVSTSARLRTRYPPPRLRHRSGVSGGGRGLRPPSPAAKFGPAERTWCLYLAGQRLARRHLVSQERTARAGGWRRGRVGRPSGLGLQKRFEGHKDAQAREGQEAVGLWENLLCPLGKSSKHS